MKILCYIVTYNAASHIEGVLSQIPAQCWENPDYQFHALISDDCSTDDTVAVCQRYIATAGRPIRVRRTSHNLGYGGNQKQGYDTATREGYDAVILLHGDGQYHPKYLPAMIQPLLENAACVLGSRMLHKQKALSGGMPLYKFFGNIGLTGFQNRVMHASLAEWHTGLRAYSVRALSTIPYRYNSDGYVFDTEILIQLLDAKLPVREIPIDTHYGDEVCHVNSPKYALRVVRAMLGYKLHRLGLVYFPQYHTGPQQYPSKLDFPSSHSFALEQAFGAKCVADIGGHAGYVAQQLLTSGARVHGFDIAPPDARTDRAYSSYTQTNLDHWADSPTPAIRPDTVLLLDVLEHLREPQDLLFRLRDMLEPGSRVIITLPNIAFFSIRVRMLLGLFHYTTRGLLDRTHLRFFTFSSIESMLVKQGYVIVMRRGIPAPFPLVMGRGRMSRALLKLNQLLICISRSLFAYQIGIVAMPKAISHDS